MIILFGTRAGHLKTIRLPEQCRNCKTGGSVELIVYQRFAHIFWIPIFPTRKIFTSQCYRCKESLIQEEIKESYPEVYQQYRKKLTAPFWSFTGITLVASIVLLITVLNYVRIVKEQFMIQSPEIDDIYIYVPKEGEYSLWKVSEINGDTVFVLSNSFTTNSIRKISVSAYSFNKEASPKLRSDLIRMFENKEIVSIERE